MYFVAVTLFSQLLPALLCKQFCQQALDMRKQFFVHRIVSLAIINRRVFNVEYYRAETNRI